MNLLAILGATLQFLLSIKGMAVFGAGLVLFLAMPIIPQILGVGYKLANFHLWLATASVRRAAIVVSEANEVFYKQMSFDDTGVMQISLDDDTKDFEDPDDALHHWMGVPFALADEKHGILFDPRHCAIGRRKHDLEEVGEGEYLPTQDEWETHGIDMWKPGVFEMPKMHELVDLSMVRQLVDGGERAEYPTRVESLYKHSQSPFAKALGSFKMLVPILGPLLVLAGNWIIASQGGGGGSITDSVGYGTTSLGLLLSVPSAKALVDKVRSVDWLLLGKYTLLVTPLPLGWLALAVFINPIYAVVVYVILGMGFWLLPILSFIFRISSLVSGVFSKLFFRLGFLGYTQPVFEWTPETYCLRDGRHLDTSNVRWYGLFGRRVGFTFPPEKESWDAEAMTNDEVTSGQVRADGGESITSLPEKYVKHETLGVGQYGAYVPKRVKNSKYYINARIAVGRFRHSADGEKSLRRLTQAKDKHGGQSQSISDKTLLYTTLAGGFVMQVLSVFIWWL